MRHGCHRPLSAALASLGVLAAGLVLSAAPALAAPPEKPLTKPASNVTGFTATLNGVLNPKTTAKAGYYFAYNTSESCGEGATKTEPGAEATGKAIKVSTPVTGLIPHTKYTFCVVATNGAKEETPGSPLTFETLPVKPLIEEESVSAITETAASLSAVINPELQETTCKVQFVADATFKVSEYSGAPETGCEPEEGLGSGSSGVSTGKRLTGLTPNTTYHFRVLAKNASGLSEGPDHTFLTLPNPPTAITAEASSITANSATISGSVIPGSVGPNSDTAYFFQYGTTTSYGAQAPLTPGDAGVGTSPVPVMAALSGLEAGTTYHYRILATNDNTNTPQTTYGEDNEFKTVPTPPILSAVSVSAITQSTATLTATLDPSGLPTRYELELGATQGLLQTVAFGNTTSVLPLVLNVGSLSPGTIYYYRLIATNLNGTAEPPPEGAFTTGTRPGPPGATPVQIILFPPFVAALAERAAREARESTSTSPPSKPLRKAQKLVKALKACGKKPKRQRPGCRRQAKRRYR
jgi:hypothetical protein